MKKTIDRIKGFFKMDNQEMPEPKCIDSF